MIYEGKERRQLATLTDEQMETIAEKAAEKALQKVYADVGRSIVNKIFLIVGSCVIGILLWMGSKGIKP